MSGLTKELLQDIHQVVNEATKPSSPKTKKKTVINVKTETGEEFNTTEEQIVKVIANRPDGKYTLKIKGDDHPAAMAFLIYRNSAARKAWAYTAQGAFVEIPNSDSYQNKWSNIADKLSAN